MPIALRWRDGGTGVVVTGTGTVTAGDVQAARAQVEAGTTSALRHQLVDFTRVGSATVPFGHLRVLAGADRAAARHSGGLVIAVAAARDAIFGLARYWEAYAESPFLRTHVFRTVEEAEGWIADALASPPVPTQVRSASRL